MKPQEYWDQVKKNKLFLSSRYGVPGHVSEFSDRVALIEGPLNLLLESFFHELNKMKPRQREVFLLRRGWIDGTPKTYQEIGESVGLTRERVRQIYAKADDTIKYHLINDKKFIIQIGNSSPIREQWSPLDFSVNPSPPPDTTP